MFLDFYRLHQQPFGVTPDPAYLYPSRTHCEALDALTEGILSARGFLALIAEPGMGKTTLLYQVLDGLRGTARAAFLFQTQCNSREFFQYLLSELGVDATGMGLVAMHNKLNEMLFAEMLAGRRFVLIVDEAQNLDEPVLETIRLLSNFETSHTKLLQIILAGQPQLGDKLGQKQLSQLLQRIAVVQRLEALSPQETAGYVRHRLKIGGHSGEEIFEPEALALVAERSGGVPRTINNLCFHTLLEGYAQGRRSISADIVDKADRKLRVLPTTLSVSAPEAPATDSENASGTSAPQLTYKPRAKFGLHGWVIWICALAAFVLPAGAALPHYGLSKMMSAILASPLHHNARRSSASAAAAGIAFADPSPVSARTEEVDDRLQSPGMHEMTNSDQLPRAAQGTPDVTAIQVSSTQNDARIVVQLDSAVQYNSARISAPERIYFDLYKARLSPSVAQKTVPVQDGLLKWVRAAQNTDDVVRLVLDADKAKAYSAQLLSDPYRLVIDVHAQSAAVASGGATSVAQQSNGGNASLANASRQTHPSLTQELGLKISRIAIDPGHGGYDTGAMGPHGLMEKNLCLDVALRLGRLIQDNVPGAEVIYTRTTDKYVSLEDRTAIANRAHADLFISIHANSSDSPEARGVETYYLSLLASPESMRLATRENAFAQSSLHDLPELIQKITRNAKIAESKLFAQDIQSALAARLQIVSRGETNRGVKRAPFVVLTGADMPAVLSEISFISNASDESLLLDSAQRQRVAESLYRGIETYLDSLNSLPARKQPLVSQNSPNAPAVLPASESAFERNSQ
ncbi:MAG TPA: N-acetylmuramoyl-L-alanine amidase [Candidatus Acidoferrales bacterium]|jgi:N-acetylmuramoyl-L-alanine amidase|nr:N-acetylmuramoyl-L-alanine amidase [Candidatus Acidoferrales bacterium]